MQSEVGTYRDYYLGGGGDGRWKGQIGISADFHLAGKKAFDRNLVSSSRGLVPYINLLNCYLSPEKKRWLCFWLF